MPRPAFPHFLESWASLSFQPRSYSKRTQSRLRNSIASPSPAPVLTSASTGSERCSASVDSFCSRFHLRTQQEDQPESDADHPPAQGCASRAARVADPLPPAAHPSLPPSADRILCLGKKARAESFGILRQPRRGGSCSCPAPPPTGSLERAAFCLNVGHRVRSLGQLQYFNLLREPHVTPHALPSPGAS